MKHLFHNTIQEVNQLALFSANNLSQEAFMLSVMVKGKEYSPYDLLELCEAMGRKIKENSIRRAINHLLDKERYPTEPIELTGNRVVNTKYSNVSNATIILR